MSEKLNFIEFDCSFSGVISSVLYRKTFFFRYEFNYRHRHSLVTNHLIICVLSWQRFHHIVTYVETQKKIDVTFQMFGNQLLTAFSSKLVLIVIINDSSSMAERKLKLHCRDSTICCNKIMIITMYVRSQNFFFFLIFVSYKFHQINRFIDSSINVWCYI